MSDRLYDMGQISRTAEIERLRARLAEAERNAETLWRENEVNKARLAEVQDKLSIALAANHDLRDERDSLKDRLADPCKTYDKDGRLLTVCNRLAEAEALLRKMRPYVSGLAGTDGEPFTDRIAAFLARENERG